MEGPWTGRWRVVRCDIRDDPGQKWIVKDPRQPSEDFEFCLGVTESQRQAISRRSDMSIFHVLKDHSGHRRSVS